MKRYSVATIAQIIVVLLLGTVLTAHADDWQKGKDALAKGDTLEAIKYLKDAVKKDKKNKEISLLLGKAYFAVDSLDQAIGAFVQARELDTLSPDIHILIGNVYMKQRITSAAIAEYETAASLDSMNANNYKLIGRACIIAREYGKGIGYLARAAQLDTTDLSVYREVGLLYVRGKNTEKALRYLKFVYEKNHQDSTRLAYANGLVETRRYADFIPVANAILKDDSSHKDLLTGLMIAYTATNDTADAEKIFALVGAAPQGKTCKDKLDYANVLKKLGKHEQAVAAFLGVLECDSTLGSEVYYSLGTEYMAVKDYEKAVPQFDKMVAVDKSGNFRFASDYNAAISLMQLKKFDEAKNHIQDGLIAKPGYLPLWRSLAICYRQMDSIPEARAAYKQILAIYDTSSTKEKYNDMAADAYRTEGFYLLLDKKLPSSIEMFLKSLTLDANDCQTLLWTSQAYAMSNLRDNAKKYACKVIGNCGKGGAGEAKLVQDAKSVLAQLGVECK